MPSDNTTINAGSGGDLIADDYITDGGVANGAKVQRMKPGYGTDGNYTDVSASAPLPTTIDSGTLMQRIELLEMVLGRLLSGAGGQPHDGSGRTRVVLEATSGTSLSLNTVTTVTAVTTLSKMGLWALGPDHAMLSQVNLPALMLRDRITVS